MWREYFADGLIVGLDLNANPFESMPDRVRFYQGSQDDRTLLDRVAAECAPDGFDVIIDDASHIGRLSRDSFNGLFERHLKPGGIYVIEDSGHRVLGEVARRRGLSTGQGTPSQCEFRCGAIIESSCAVTGIAARYGERPRIRSP